MDWGQVILSLTGHRGVVISVSFSPDRKRVFARNAQTKVLCRSITDGKPADLADQPARPGSFARRSPRGQNRRLAHRHRGSAPACPWLLPDATRRKQHHTDQAALAETEEKWFAVSFHIGRLLHDDPDNADLKKRREEALQKLAGP